MCMCHYVVEVVILLNFLKYLICVLCDCLQTVAYNILWDVKLLLRYKYTHCLSTESHAVL